MGANWRELTSLETVSRRTGGRRRYNAWRQFMALHRRHQVVQLLAVHGFGHGVQAKIARELGVSEATISRDMLALQNRYAPCPHCGRLMALNESPRTAAESLLKAIAL